MEKQKEFLMKTVKLIGENPGLEVFTMTHYEVCASDGGYWKGSIERADVELYYEDGDGGMHFGKDEIVEYLDTKDSEEVYDALYRTGKIKKAIIVWISL